MPMQVVTPEELSVRDKRLEALEFQMQVVMLVLPAFEWASREQALRILKVTNPTLKSMAEKGIIGYVKGKRKVEYNLSSMITYLIEKKRLYPHAVKERLQEVLTTTKAAA